jgi:hypothetical protein
MILACLPSSGGSLYPGDCLPSSPSLVWLEFQAGAPLCCLPELPVKIFCCFLVFIDKNIFSQK